MAVIEASETVISNVVVLPDAVTVMVFAPAELLSKPDSLRQQNRGDTFINYARRVMQSNHKKLPSRFEEELEMRFENRYPHFHERFGTPF